MKTDINVSASIFGLALLLLIIGGCITEARDPASKTPPAKPVNIVVIIDTSDRVATAKHPMQAKNDLTITENIVHIFEEAFVSRSLYIGSKDTLAFVVPEQPNIPPVQLDLKIWPNRTQRAGGAPKFKAMKTALLAALKTLYDSVAEQTEFTGSDIWKWFRDSANIYLKPDKRNYIICISDGYLDFNRSIQEQRPKGTYIDYAQVAQFRDTPNWKAKFHAEGHGLLGIGRDFSDYDVKFLMVEITHRHILDLEIIAEYWRVWLDSMGITDTQFLPTQADPHVVIDQITNFLSADGAK